MTVLRLITLVTLTLILGCSSHEELPPPDNPFDPGNPNYVSPSAQIISGPTENEIMDVTTVTFGWQGNESATEYSYQFDDSGWSEWSESTAAEFDYLDEGDHIFRVQSKSINGDTQEIPTIVSFGVDAVAGPSVLVYPYRQSGSPGDTLEYQIIAEEVSDLFAVECHVTVDAEYLELIEIVDGNILGEWGGSPLVLEELSPSSLSISMVAVQGTSTSFSGTTSLINIKVRIKSTVNISSEHIAIEVVENIYLDPELRLINFASKRVGVLDVH